MTSFISHALRARARMVLQAKTEPARQLEPNKSRNAEKGVCITAPPPSAKNVAALGENLESQRSSGASSAIRKWTRMQVCKQSLSSLCCHPVNYMDCNQLVTSYIPIFTTPQKKFNHGGCTYTGNLPVSLHSALYLRNYTASNLGELFLYKKNSERYVIDTTAAHTPQAVN